MSSWKDTIKPIDSSAEPSGTWRDSVKPINSDQPMYNADQSKDYSKMDSFGTGIQGGATLGFNDEIGGLAGALGAKSGGDTRNFWDIYREIRDVNRTENSNSEHQNPGSTLAGNLVGGLVVPGLGEAKSAGTVTKTLGQKVGQMAIAGGKAGAIAGIGTSKHDLTKGDVAGNIEDAGSGLAGGTLVGAGLQLGGSAIKGTAKMGKEVLGAFPWAQDIGEVFRRTKAGQELSGPGRVDQFSQENRDLARNIIDDIEGLRNFSGKAMGASLKEVEDHAGPMKVDDIVDGINQKIEALKASHPEEVKDIENLKATLRQLVDEQTKTVTRLIPKSQLKGPEVTADQAAINNVTKRTAEDKVKNELKLERLAEMLNNSEDPAERDALKTMIDNLVSKKDYEYPPVKINEELTGMDVQAVNRPGSPIVKAVVPKPEPGFTPLAPIESQVTTRGRTEINPSELSNVMRSLQTSYDTSGTKVGKDLALDAKAQLNQRLQQTAQGNPDAQAGAEAYNSGKEAFGGVGETQKLLGLPDYFGNDSSSKVNAINKLQKAIQDYHTPGGKNKQVLQEALKELEPYFPGTSQRIMSEIGEGATKERLARELTSQSAFPSNPVESVKSMSPWQMMGASAKAATLQTARAVGKVAANASESAGDASKAVTTLGKAVNDATPDTIKNMANAMGQKTGPWGQNTAKALNDIVNAPMAKRRAILFTLMQQPSFRDFAKQYLGNMIEDTNQK